MTKRIRSIFVFTGLATSLLLLAIYPPMRSVIKTVLWGVAWAALLSPLCAVFEGFLKRGWAVALAVLSSFLFIGVLIALLLPPVIAQSVALSAQMPQILLGVQQLIERGQAFLSGYGIQLSGGGQFIAQRLSGIGAQLGPKRLAPDGRFDGRSVTHADCARAGHLLFKGSRSIRLPAFHVYSAPL